MTIIAVDLGSPSLNATTNLIVQVIDKPDNIPTFNQSLYEATARTTDKSGKHLLTLQAGENVRYNITGQGYKNLSQCQIFSTVRVIT